MDKALKVTVIGQIEDESTTFWFDETFDVLEAVSIARYWWITDFHGEPAEIKVENLKKSA